MDAMIGTLRDIHRAQTAALPNYGGWNLELQAMQDREGTISAFCLRPFVALQN